MTIEGRRFVFINGFSLVLNSFDTSSVTYTVVFRLSVAVQLIAWKDFSRVTCCVSSRNYNHTNLGALSTDRTVFTMVSAKQFCLCYFFKWTELVRNLHCQFVFVFSLPFCICYYSVISSLLSVCWYINSSAQRTSGLHFTFVLSWNNCFSYTFVDTKVSLQYFIT